MPKGEGLYPAPTHRRVEELDQEIMALGKSTRAVVPAMIPLHDILRQKFRWYYNWSSFPASKAIHWAVLLFYLAGAVAFGMNFVSSPQKASAASVKKWDTKEEWKEWRLDNLSLDIKPGSLTLAPEQLVRANRAVAGVRTIAQAVNEGTGEVTPAESNSDESSNQTDPNSNIGTDNTNETEQPDQPANLDQNTQPKETPIEETPAEENKSIQYVSSGSGIFRFTPHKDEIVKWLSVNLSAENNGQTVSAKYSTDQIVWSTDIEKLANSEILYVYLKLATTDPTVSPVIDALAVNYSRLPEKPVVISPTNGEKIDDRSPTLSAGDFSDIDNDNFYSSRWQVTRESGNYSAAIIDETLKRPRANYSIGQRLEDGVYFWRVRYQDSTGAWSLWSDEGVFIVGEENNNEIKQSRTETTKTFDNGNGTNTLVSYSGLAHYKENYADSNSPWKDINPYHTVDYPKYVLHDQLPATVKVYKDKIGYEIESRKTGEKYAVELVKTDGETNLKTAVDPEEIAPPVETTIEPNTTEGDSQSQTQENIQSYLNDLSPALNSASAQIAQEAGNLDFDYQIGEYGVRLWKTLDEGAPKEFTWKVTKEGNGESLAFRENPEAFEVSGDKILKNKPVEIAVEKDQLNSNSFTWTETAPKTGVKIDTDVTYYPNPDAESTSVDGYSRYFADNTAWATAHDASSGTEVSDNGASAFLAHLCKPTAFGAVRSLGRNFYFFDTSALGSGATISASIFSVYTFGKSDVPAINPSYNVYQVNSSSANISLSTADYNKNNWGTTGLSDTALTYTNVSTGGYNDFTLNSSGRSAIDKTGITKIGVRTSNYDASDTTLSGTSAAPCTASAISTYFAEQTGTSNDPKLAITYTAASPPTAPTIGSPSAQSSSSIRWAFTDNASDETGFKVHNSSHSVMATCATANLTYCDETGLSVNTQYSGRHVHAYNATGDSTGSADATATYTLANVPSAPTVDTATSSSLKVTINTNSNPAATNFAIYNDTLAKYVGADGVADEASEVWQTVAQWNTTGYIVNTGLTANTSYTYKVKAKNGDNTATALSSGTSLSTLEAGITISGTAYTSDTKSATITDGTSIGLSIDGGTKFTTTTTTGVFSFTKEVSANNTITLFFGTNYEGNLITQAIDSSTNITGLELFANDIVLTHQTAGPMTNTLLATANNCADCGSSIHYTDSSGNIAFDENYKIWIPASKTYTPGANITSMGAFTNNGTFNPEGNSYSFSGTFTNAGTINSSTSTANFVATSGTLTLTSGGMQFKNFLINASGATIRPSGTLDIAGTFTLQAGTLDLDTNDPTVNLRGNITISGGTLTKGSGTVNLLGDITYNAPSYNFGTVVIGASPDSTTLASDFTADTLTVSAGDTLYTRGYEVDIASGGITIATGAPGGTLDATDTGGVGYEGDGSIITCAGNFTINSGGVFTKEDDNGRTSLVKIDAGGAANLTSGSQDLGNFQISTASTNVTLQDALNVDALTIDASTTLTRNGKTINVAGNWANSGTFTHGNAGTVTFDGAGTQTINSGGTGAGKTFYGVTHSGAGTAQLITNTINIDGDFTNSGGTWDANGQNMTVAGSWSNSATFDHGDATVTFDGDTTGKTLTAGGDDFYNLTVNASTLVTPGSETLRPNSDIVQLFAPSGCINRYECVSDQSDTTYVIRLPDAGGGYAVYGVPAHSVPADATNITVTVGMRIDTDDLVNNVGITMVRAGGNDYYGGGIQIADTWTNFTYEWTTNPNTSVAWTYGDLATTYPALYLSTGENAAAFASEVWMVIDYETSQTGSWTAQDSIVVTNTATISSGTLTAGANTVTTHDYTQSGGTYSASTGTTTISGTMNRTSGTYTHNSGLTKFTSTASENITSGGATFKNVTFDGVAGDWTLQDALTMAGSSTLTITNGTLDIASQNIDLGASSTFSNSGTLQLVGAGSQTISNFTNDTDSGLVEYTGGASYTGLKAGNNYYDLTMNGAGTYTLNAALDANRDLTLSNGTLAASTYQINIARNWAKGSGTFTANTGKVVLDGAGGSTQTISGSTTFNNLEATAATARTITFTAGTTQTVGGTWTVTGAVGQLITLQSSAASAWDIAPTAASVSYANISYSNNTSGTTICATYSTDGLNNTDWDITALSFCGTSISGTVYTAESKLTNIGENKTVAASVNGGDKYTDETNASGEFTISVPSIAANDPIVIFVDGETEAANLITQASGTGDITGLELYTDKIVLTHETAGPMTNTILNASNNIVGGDTDIHYTDDGGFDTTYELFIQTGKSYTPGGTVTSIGDFDNNGTFTPEANTINVAGSWDNANTATFTAGGSTINFNGSTASKTITAGGDPFYSLIVAGQSGSSGSQTKYAGSGTNSGTGTTWASTGNIVSDNSSFATLTSYDDTITSSNLVSSNHGFTIPDGATINKIKVTVRSGIRNDCSSGGFTLNTAKLVRAGSIVGSAWNSGDLQASISSGTWGALVTGSTGDGAVSSWGAGTWTSSDINNSGFGFALKVDGTSSGCGENQSDLGVDSIKIVVEYNQPAADWTLQDALTIANITTISSGTLTAGANTVTTHDYTQSGGTYSASTGTTTISGTMNRTGGTYTHNSGLTKFTSTTTENITSGGATFKNITFDGVSGVWTLQDALTQASSSTLTITNGTLNLASQNFDMGSSSTFSNDGTLKLVGAASQTISNFTNDTNSGLVEYTGGASYTGLKAGNNYYNLTFSGAGTYTLSAAADINYDLNLAGGALAASSYQINVAHNWNKTSGSLTANTGKVVLDGAGGSTQTIIGSNTFNNLEATDTGAARNITFTGNTTQTVGGTWTVTGASGKLITLQSSDSNNWTINPTTATASYLTVDRSTNTGVAFCAAYSTGTNTVAWNFSAGASCDGTIQFTSASSNGAESTTSVDIEVSIGQSQPSNASVDYAVTGGTATGGGTDYTLASGTATITAGNTTTNINLTVVNDSLDEDNETIEITLSNPTNAILGANTVYTYTINDNDDAPTIAFTLASSSGGESATPAQLQLTLSTLSGKNVSVDYAVTGGTATSGGTDYTLASGTASITAGNLTTTIDSVIVSDSLDEDDETIIVTISNPSNATLGVNTVHTYTINDDDSAPTVQFSTASANGSEATTPVAVTVELSAVSGKNISVDYNVTGGTATGSGEDYTLANGTASITASSLNTNFNIVVANDLLDEEDETIQITLSNPSNTTLGVNTVYTYTIQDNDAEPTVQFSADTASGSEGTTPVTVTVELSSASGKTITADYAVTGGTATGTGTDYTLANGTATITAGNTTTTFNIVVVNDALDEDDETIILTLSNPANATLGVTTQYTYTILDNDSAPTISFSSASSSASEAATPANLAVTLSAASSKTITVDYAATGGTATGTGTDYTLASGTLTFTAGQTSNNISATIVDDLDQEGDETIIVAISAPTNATLGATTTHTYTILDNDSITINNLLMKLPGQTFTDGVGISGSATTQTAGSAFSGTTYAVNATENLVNTYTETVSYSNTTDTFLATYGTANTPCAASALVAGQKTVNCTFYKTGSHRIDLDSVDSSGVSSYITIAPADTSSTVSTATPASQSIGAGQTASITVTLKDPYTNINTGHSVLATSNQAGDVITYSGSTTNSSGQITIYVTSYFIHESTITITDETDSVVLSTQPTIDFIDPGISNPTNFTGTAGNQETNLSWANPSSNIFDHVELYRSTTRGELGNLIADNLSATTYHDTGLTNEVTYYYTLKAVNIFGTKSSGTEQLALTPTDETDYEPPTNPANLRAVEIGCQAITLRWDASTDNKGVVGYLIFNTDTNIQVASTSSTTYELNNLSQGSTYSFAIKAYDAAGNQSGYSNTLNVTTLSGEACSTIEPPVTVTLYLVIGNAPSEVLSGAAFKENLRVTVVDGGGSIQKDYRGTIRFSSTDTKASLQWDNGNPYNFTSQDAGQHDFAGNGFVLKTVGKQRLSVTDGASNGNVEVLVKSNNIPETYQKYQNRVVDFIANNAGKINTAVFTTTAALLLAPFLINTLIGLGNLGPQVLYWLNQLLQLIGLRKRRKPWGVVFNSKTGQSIPMAIVKIYNKEYNRLLESTVTDREGRFGFLTREGTFYLVVKKEGFNFPSEYKASNFYEHIYTGEIIEIKNNSKEAITFNIPVDPQVEPSAKYKMLIFLIKFVKFIRKIRIPLLILGMIFAVIMLIYVFHIVYVLSIVFYGFVILLDYLRTFNARPYGVVSDIYGHPIGMAIIRIYEKKHNRLIETDVADDQGRFKFLVKPGVYYLTAAKPGFVDYKSHVMYLEHEKTMVSSNIKMEKLQK